MTLYVWSGDGVLKNYGSGYCIVLANSLEEAREMARNEIIELYSYLLSPSQHWLDEDDYELIDRKTKFLANEPKVYTQPAAFAIEGSE